MNRESLVTFTSQHRLIVAIAGAVLVAIIMTAVSLSLYFTSGAHVLDISRPGYESTLQAIKQAQYDADSFAQDGPINSEVINEFEEIYQGNRDHLQAIDDFSDQEVLSDPNLRLSR